MQSTRDHPSIVDPSRNRLVLRQVRSIADLASSDSQNNDAIRMRSTSTPP
jgi:hypothetical protein